MQVKAWLWNEPTEPSNLQLTDREIPAPQPGEVLVENRAIALNPVDWKLVRSKTNGWQPGHIPGVDAAGIVIACGEHTNFPTGTRVAFHHDLTKDGTFATHTVVAAKALLKIPDTVSFATAATVPCPGLTAWQAISKIPVIPERDILIIGGASATGTWLVQLAVQRGYRVWTTASRRHHGTLLELGAEGVFDYHDPNWNDALLQALEGRRLYAAIDNIGSQHARTLAPLIGYNGHLVCIAGRLPEPPLPAFSTVISLHEVALGAIYQHGRDADWAALRHSGAQLLNGIADRSMKPPQIQNFSFDHLADALATLHAGKQQGKLIAEVGQ
jgi:NADPH:quinone reductase-like Zn-dependent oxidoreductase